MIELNRGVWTHDRLLRYFELGALSGPECRGELLPLGRELIPTHVAYFLAILPVQIFYCESCDHVLFAEEDPLHRRPRPVVALGFPAGYVCVGVRDCRASDCTVQRPRGNHP